MTAADAEFIHYIVTRSGMPNAGEMDRLRGIIENEKMHLRRILSWIEPEKARSE